MHTRRKPLLALGGASALIALTGCAPGQPLGPDCPMVDFDVLISVTVETDKELEAVGICDEIACTTDAEIPESSEVSGVYAYEQHDDTSTWNFSVIRWMPQTFGLVAVVDGEEIDLGQHEADIEYHDIVEGADCGSIPEYAPVTVEL